MKPCRLKLPLVSLFLLQTSYEYVSFESYRILNFLILSKIKILTSLNTGALSFSSRIIAVTGICTRLFGSPSPTSSSKVTRNFSVSLTWK